MASTVKTMTITVPCNCGASIQAKITDPQYIRCPKCHSTVDINDVYVALAAAYGLKRDQLENFGKHGYLPQPKQLEFHGLARTADHPNGPMLLGSGGARGSAKSHCAVTQMALDDCMRKPQLKALFLRSIVASAKEAFDDILRKVIPTLAPYYKPSQNRIELPNRSRILLGGFRTDRDIDKFIGLEYDVILIDDAHLISRSKHEQILGSLRTSKKKWRPRAYYTFNPGGSGHNFLKSTFVDSAARNYSLVSDSKARFVFSLPEDNRFINPEYLAYLEGLTGWLKRAWRYGDFNIAAGQFFNTWSEDIHVINSFVPSLNTRWWLSMDYGWAHYTVIHLHAYDEDNDIIYTVDEHAERYWVIKRHAEAVYDMLKKWGIARQSLDKFVAGKDCFDRQATGATIADQWRQFGFTLRRADTNRISGAAEILRRLGDTSSDIPPKWFVHRNCMRLIDCIPILEHDPNRPEDVLKVDVDERGEGGDDAAECARFGIMAAGRGRGKAKSYPYA